MLKCPLGSTGGEAARRAEAARAGAGAGAAGGTGATALPTYLVHTGKRFFFILTKEQWPNFFSLFGWHNPNCPKASAAAFVHQLQLTPVFTVGE